MKHKKSTYGLYLFVALVAVVLVGFFVPLASYTAKGCSSPPITHRLSLIHGETLEKPKEDYLRQKAEDDLRRSDISQPMLNSCRATIEYVLYFF